MDKNIKLKEKDKVFYRPKNSDYIYDFTVADLAGMTIKEVEDRENCIITKVRREVTIYNNLSLEEKQKYFKDWLENKAKERDKDVKLIGSDVYTSKFAYHEVLDKYNEIMGDDEQ